MSQIWLTFTGLRGVIISQKIEPLKYNVTTGNTTQLFSSPSSVGLVTIFHCLRLEISIFVTSYDSQGYGGGIRLRLHTPS
jgi:hypothetical protein